MSRRLAIALSVAVALTFVGYNSQAREKVTKKKGLVHEMSGQPYGTAGCGLGSILFADQEGLIQVVAATFNATAGNQTFAISSGTSNCEQAERNASAALFIESNKVALQDDVARGSGETLTAFSKIIGCGDSVLLGKALQKNYGRIYSGSGSSAEVRDNVLRTISSDQGLIQSCKG